MIPQYVLYKKHVLGKLLNIQLLGCQKRCEQWEDVFSSKFYTILNQTH